MVNTADSRLPRTDSKSAGLQRTSDSVYQVEVHRRHWRHNVVRGRHPYAMGTAPMFSESSSSPIVSEVFIMVYWFRGLQTIVYIIVEPEVIETSGALPKIFILP